MALDEPSCLKKLKTMREQVDWKIRKERHKFFLQLYPLVKDWNGQLPNLKDIFRPKEIDWLLTDSINHRGKGKGYGREIFVKFVARTGYKDEPEVGEGSELPLRHTTALHCAARLGPEKFSKESVNKLFLIYDRFEVNYTDNRGITHFHAACEYGCYEVVEKFLELGLDPNCRTKKWGLTPIILALSWGHGRVAELLLRNGAHLHTTDRFGCTPLHLICQKKYDYDLVELFFKIFDEQHQLVEVNARDKLDRTPLHYAAERHFKKVIELLLKRGADMNLVDTYGSTPLHKICAKTSDFGYDDTADIDGGLVELFFKISDEKHQPVEVNARDTGDRTPLHYAVKRGCRFKRTTELLLRRGADANSADENGSTPLHLISNLSCKCNEEDYRDNNYCLLELFFNICDEQHQLVEINARDKYGATPLHYAVDHKLKKTTELLLRRGANPNLAIDFTQCTVYWIGLTPLHMICQRDVSAIFLKFFFDVNDEIHQTVEVDALDKDGNTPLHFTLLSRFFRLAEVLLRGGANPNLVNENGSPPLHLICGIHKDDEGAAFLKIFFEICAEKNHKVQVDARNEEGQTPLQLALDYRNKKVAELLLKNGADPNLSNRDGSTALHLICQLHLGDNFVKTFFKICDEKHYKVHIDAQDEWGKTPLRIALCSVCEKVVEVLLRNGANPNLVDENGRTPLHMMCKRKNDVKSIMTTLQIFFDVSDEVHRSVEVDTLDKDGETPLHSSLQRNKMNMTELLLRRGANPNLVNKDGSTALHLICQSNGDDDFVETFFKICDEKHQTVQVDIRDNLGRTPLQLAVQNFMPDSVELLLNRGADLSGIIFPTASDIRKCLRFSIVYQSPLKGASRVLSVVERLEKKGYELNRSDVSMIMKTFAGYKVTDNSERIEMLSRDEKLMSAAKKLMINPGLSFYDLIRMRPKTTKKLLTYTDYLKFGSSNQLRELPEYSYERCIALVVEIMSRGFYWQWALEFFMELTRCQLPILCCEKIIDLLNNEDLLRICQAAEIVAKEASQNN